MTSNLRNAPSLAAIKNIQSSVTADINPEFLYNYELSDLAKDKSDIYYLHHWSTKKLQKSISHNGEVIFKNSTTFVVQWVNAMQKRVLLSGAINHRVALSFRRQNGMKIGYVIPKILYGEEAPLDTEAGA